jgi:adenine-specific DNA-methyltransferase
MATGTPRSPRRNGATAPDDAIKVELSYPGKRSLSEILTTPPGTFQNVTTDSANKRLYFAENLATLAALADDKSVRGNVRLVYIDPPYATQTVFHSRKLAHAYEDVFQTVEYIDFLRERLVFLHNIIAEDGSIYIHIDDKMLFHVKLVMDEIFGAENYRNCITRKKCNPKNYTRKTFGNVADYILFYTKSDKYIWNRQVEPWTAERAKEYQYVEPETGRYYMKVPVHAPGIRNGAKGEIFWSSNGNPRRKVYLDKSEGIPVQDIWMGFRDAHNQNIHITGYPTEKNFDLLKRIVEASSNPGDIVLDCFAGSGTTLVAADALGRNWIGIDNSPEALRTVLHRFAHGTEAMGDFVSKKDEITAPTLFDLIPGGADEPTSQNDAHRVQHFTLLAEAANAVKAEQIVKQTAGAA